MSKCVSNKGEYNIVNIHTCMLGSKTTLKFLEQNEKSRLGEFNTNMILMVRRTVGKQQVTYLTSLCEWIGQ